VIACAVALGVSSCSRAPTDAELAEAAAAREDGHRMLASFDLIGAEKSILDHFPVGGWLANDVVHEDRGDLLDRLPELIASGESEVVAATVSVRYFRDAPGAPD
jgi:hypothetical protein